MSTSKKEGDSVKVKAEELHTQMPLSEKDEVKQAEEKARQRNSGSADQKSGKK